MKHILLLLSVLFALPVFSQKMKTVEGEYTYHAPENVTLEEAKRIALDRAKIQALADVFGTIVSQTNATHVQNRNGSSDIDFLSIGGSEVKGEWIETVGEPQYDISYEQGMLVVKVSVKGKAREIVSAQIDIKAKVLRNGTEDKFESDGFRDGDDLYLSFVSPVSGYLAVYLVDAEQKAYCLLPYRSQTDGIYKVEANRRYVFFNIKEAPPQERQYVDEYVMTCSRSSEYNQIYVIFSPQPFAKAVDSSSSETLPRELGLEDFQKWLVNIRRKDYRTILINKQIIINMK
ncbi:MAG: DUF4384 domain-containing protein [Prevotella sp.]|nr:DUF4384 domain-containing protein [Prevotella sp.]